MTRGFDRTRTRRPVPQRLPEAAMSAWYTTPLGRRVLHIEQRELDAVLPYLFGYQLVQLGRTPEELFQASRIRHKAVMDIASPSEMSTDPTGPGLRSLVGRPEALPLSPDSVDVLLLPHVLEFAESPHDVLREADRSLIPEGHLVVLGFNPWSLWMLWRWARGRRGGMPWSGRFYSSVRLRDWLALLGFDIVLTRYYFFQPPLHHEAIMNRCGFAERIGRRAWPVLGAGYLLVARKRVTTLTPIRPRWRPRRRFAPAGVTSPE